MDALSTEGLKTGKINISTSTYIANSGIKFDLESIYKNIILDDALLGLKYNNEARGDIKGTKTFFNQISMRINLKKHTKETNLKVFSNGKFQITGVKNPEHVADSIKIFLEKLPEIRGRYTQEVIVDNDTGIVFHKDLYLQYKNNNLETKFCNVPMYKYNKETGNYKILGDRKQKSFSFNKKSVEFCKEDGIFVDKKHLGHRKHIYNANGDELGYFEYNMLYNRKHLVLFKAKYEKKDGNTWDIINMYKTLSGERKLVLYDSKTIFPCIYEKTKIPLTEITVEYFACEDLDFINSIKYDQLLNDISFNSIMKIEASNINASFQLALNGNLLDKISVHTEISSNRYPLLSYYKADTKYQAISLRIYTDSQMNIVDFSEKKNIYFKFTATVFQTGKIMLSGCRTKKQILFARSVILDIFNKNYQKFIIKKIQQSIESIDETLSIWDIY
jgi:TATA-box binding protein (TBP) (component of TFIID and TFIIIB)